MAVLLTTLWAQYPSNLGNDKPCITDGKENFENQDHKGAESFDNVQTLHIYPYQNLLE